MEKPQPVNCNQLGDIEYFEQLYNKNKQRALGTAYLIGGNKNIAEDIVQEAFVIAYYQINQLKNPDMFNIWFYRILVRVGWRMASKHKRLTPIENIDEDQTLYSCHFKNNDMSDEKLILREAINNLPPSLKTVVILHYFNDLTIKEMAKILNCFQGTIKSRLFKARKLLKKDLKGFYEESEIQIMAKGLN